MHFVAKPGTSVREQDRQVDRAQHELLEDARRHARRHAHRPGHARRRGLRRELLRAWISLLSRTPTTTWRKSERARDRRQATPAGSATCRPTCTSGSRRCSPTDHRGRRGPHLRARTSTRWPASATRSAAQCGAARPRDVQPGRSSSSRRPDVPSTRRRRQATGSRRRRAPRGRRPDGQRADLDDLHPTTRSSRRRRVDHAGYPQRTSPSLRSCPSTRRPAATCRSARSPRSRSRRRRADHRENGAGDRGDADISGRRPSSVIVAGEVKALLKTVKLPAGYPPHCWASRRAGGRAEAADWLGPRRAGVILLLLQAAFRTWRLGAGCSSPALRPDRRRACRLGRAGMIRSARLSGSSPCSASRRGTGS